jgi:hypothetical protein
MWHTSSAPCTVHGHQWCTTWKREVAPVAHLCMLLVILCKKEKSAKVSEESVDFLLTDILFF